VFLEKLETFLAAYAERYDGNPNVEFVDIGTYGLWGEGHTHASSRQDSFELKRRHIDLHLKHFEKTLLCISDDFAGHDEPGDHFPITDYALSRGITLRDDSILANPHKNAPPWYHAEMAQSFWPRLPVILEHQHYGPCKRLQRWNPDVILESVETYHASFMSIHGFPKEYLAENRAMIDKINMRIGYRLLPTSVTWPRTVSIATAQSAFTDYRDATKASDPGKRFTVQWSWINQGVAPCYPGGFPTLTLKDDRGGIVSVLVDETLDLRSLKVGEPGKAPAVSHESTFTVGLYAPVTRPGTYDLFVSVGTHDGTPTIALPLEGDDGGMRYRLGEITLTED
jgi:hypothetical protein